MSCENVVKNLGEIHSRLFDHRPVLNGEVNFHLKEFEEKRNDRESVRLRKALHYVDETSEKLIPACVQLMDICLPDIQAKITTASEMCRLIDEREKEDGEPVDWLRTRRANRVREWSRFMDDMCERTAAVDHDHDEETTRLTDYYADLERKLKLTAS